MKLRQGFGPLVDHGISILAALFVVFLLRSSFYESFKIPSGSMIPTILIGDHVFVNKFAYRLTLPFSEYFGEPVTLFHREGPKPGDIIVFQSPRNPKINYIKRVVAVGGDRVRLRDRRLYVNDREIPSEEPVGEEFERMAELLWGGSSEDKGMRLGWETLGDTKHWLLLDRNNFVSENFGPIEVPAGRVFVMGDNRDFSDDSRFIGPIDVEKIKGRASWIWLSIWLNFRPYEFEFRPTRTGRSLYSL